MIAFSYNKIHGIYKILNIINNKVYIGSSINLYKRIKEHFYTLKKDKHSNKYLQNAYNKHLIENFKVEILEEVIDKKLLLERKQYYIDFFNATNPDNGYNICPIAGNTLGQKFSAESKQKMSDKAKLRIGIKNSAWGLPRPDLIIRNQLRKGRKLSKEHIQKIKDKSRSRSVMQFNEYNELVNKFISLNEAAKQTKISISSIYKCCIGERKSAGLFIWVFINEENKNNIYKKVSNEFKLTKIKSNRAVIQYDLNNNLINIFSSIKEAAQSLETFIGNIIRSCDDKKNKKSAKGFIWKYYHP